jgi:Fic family protein
VPGGWSWDGDDGDERSRLEAANGVRQARRLVELIAEAVRDPTRFELTPAMICELNGLAVAGIAKKPGRFREREVEISGSKHEPPPWQQVRSLVDEMCAYVNAGGHDAIHAAAYVLWRCNWVHPFEEGNGRTARAVAYLVLSACIGHELPGETTLVERLLWNKIRHYRALDDADRACAAGRLDVSLLEVLLDELLRAQIQGPS